MNFQTLHKQRKFVLIAALVGVIGVFCPWVSFFGVSVNGFSGVGIFIFLCLVACGAIALMGDQTKALDKTLWVITLIAGALASIIMVINLINASGGLSYVSFGFYLTLLGSLGVVAAAFMFRDPTHNIKDGFNSLKGDFNKRMNSTTTTTNTGNTTTGTGTGTNEPGSTNPPV